MRFLTQLYHKVLICCPLLPLWQFFLCCSTNNCHRKFCRKYCWQGNGLLLHLTLMMGCCYNRPLSPHVLFWAPRIPSDILQSNVVMLFRLWPFPHCCLLMAGPIRPTVSIHHGSFLCHMSHGVSVSHDLLLSPFHMSHCHIRVTRDIVVDLLCDILVELNTFILYIFVQMKTKVWTKVRK